MCVGFGRSHTTVWAPYFSPQVVNSIFRRTIIQVTVSSRRTCSVEQSGTSISSSAINDNFINLGNQVEALTTQVNGLLDGANIEDGTLTGADITDGSIEAADISTTTGTAITNANIEDGTISSATLGPGLSLPPTSLPESQRILGLRSEPRVLLLQLAIRHGPRCRE